MRSRICLVLVAIFSATCFMGAHCAISQQEHLDLQKKIVELKKERRDILKKRVDTLQSKHKEGQLEVMRVIKARDDLYLAELNLISVPAERVKLYEKRLKNLTQLEQVSAMRYENGVGPLEDKFVATATRIQAEIDLLNEQAAAN